MSEKNVAKGIVLPWVSFASDAQSLASEGKFLEQSTYLVSIAILPEYSVNMSAMKKSLP